MWLINIFIFPELALVFFGKKKKKKRKKKRVVPVAKGREAVGFRVLAL